MKRTNNTTETTTTTRKGRKARKARKVRTTRRARRTTRRTTRKMPPICRALARRIARLVSLGVTMRDASRIAVLAAAKAARA